MFIPLSKTDLKTMEIDSKGLMSFWNKLSTNVIREGEATGHKHVIIEKTAGTATMLAPAGEILPGLPNMDMIGTEDRLLTVKQPVEVVHPEHRPLNLAVGIYLIIIQREYDEVKSRRVLD